MTPPGAGPKRVDVTQTSLQSDIVGRFESSEAVTKQKTFINALTKYMNKVKDF